MANLTNSAKLIEEMEKKAYKTELPTVNNATVTVAVNGNTGTNSFTTNQASNSTLKITVGKSDVGLGNVDNTSDANKPISTATKAALDLKADKSEISSVYKYKGSKANYDALPSSGNVTGDVWNVEAAHTTAPVFPAGSNLAWDGSAWDVLGGTVDLSGYVTLSTAQTISGTKTFSAEPVLPSKSTAAGNNATKPATEAQVYLKANDADVVKTSGNQTIAGTKTFSTSPIVPSKTTDAANTGTAIATEAQVYKKQDKLTTQTAYSAKGTATKVPTITTNTLGQVTGITETSITFPVTSVNGQTGDVTIDTISKVPTTQPSNPELGSIYFDISTGAIMVYDGTEWKKAGGGSGGDVKLDPIDDLTAVKGNAQATLTWTDPDNVIIDGHTFAAWASTKLVRKAGSAPTSLSDGTLVTTSTTKNQYSSTGYVDSGLVNGTTYYYAAFAISEAGNETISNIASAKPVAYQTYTVSWTEASDPTSWVNTYSDDAAGMTQGSDDFDEFIGYSAVLLDDSGNEVAEVTQAESGGNGKLNISLLQAKGIIDGSNSSTNNVMIKFPLRGVKMTKSGSTVTLSITDEPDKSGYQYYAFNDNGTTKDALYLGAYKGSSIDSKLRSISGTSSIGNFSLNSSVDAANAHSSSRYHEESWYARCLIDAYYKLKYANPNSQSVIGMGYVRGSSAQTTGATNSIATATGATNTSNTGRIKLFGLEDRWGNVWEWMDGAYYSSGTNLQTSSTGAFLTNSRITSFDKNTTAASGWMSSIAGTNDGMFAGNGTSGSASTYYCDYFDANSGYSLLAGGNRDGGDNAGAFDVGNYSAGASRADFGSRLMFL